MYYLFILAFFCNLYSAINYPPHILLLQDEKQPAFDFLIHQTIPEPNSDFKVHCKLPILEMEDDKEDRFPIEYFIGYSSVFFLKVSIKKNKNMFQNAQWFTSKTLLQRFIIRRARDMILLTTLFGIIFCGYKTIKTALSFT